MQVKGPDSATMTKPTRSAATPRPVVLCILDGWGENPSRENNAVALAETPNWDRMVRQWPKATLDASGEDVGLPDGQMGNSEVGHLNIGAGRVVLQDLPRINAAIAAGEVADAPALNAFIDTLKASGGACHLLGLVSPGGVHSHQDHMLALAGLVAAAGIPVFIHAFLDGRDTPPKSADGYMADFIDGLAARRRTGRHRLRPLLRHGPGQELGPGCESLSCADAWRRRARCRSRRRDPRQL